MARGAPDYHDRVFTSETLATEDDIVIESATGLGVGGDIYIELGSVPAGHYWKINHIAAWDTTNSCSRIESVIKAAGVSHIISTLDSPAALELYSWDGTVWLDENWSLGIYFYGTTSGDNFELYCNGISVVRR